MLAELETLLGSKTFCLAKYFGFCGHIFEIPELCFTQGKYLLPVKIPHHRVLLCAAFDQWEQPTNGGFNLAKFTLMVGWSAIG